MSDVYPQAVEWVSNVAGHFVSDGKVHLPQISFEEVLLRTRLGILFADGAGGYERVPPSAVEEVLRLSHTDPAANIVARHLAADAFRSNRPAPEQLRIFGARIILGLESEPPVKPRRRTWLRQEFFLALTQGVLERFELKPTRNVASKENKDKPLRRSACDAVVEGLEKAGYATTYRAIQEIYSGTGRDAVRLRREAARYRKLLAACSMRHPIEKFIAEADRRRHGDERQSP